MTYNPFDDDTTQRIGAVVLTLGKRILPDRFPKIDPATARMWGEIIAECDFTAEMLPEAVTYWAGHMVTEKMATPRDITAALHVVKQRWSTDPEQQLILERRRQARRELADIAIARGIRPSQLIQEARRRMALPGDETMRTMGGELTAGHSTTKNNHLTAAEGRRPVVRADEKVKG